MTSRKAVASPLAALKLFFSALPLLLLLLQKHEQRIRQQHRAPINDGLTLISLVAASSTPFSSPPLSSSVLPVGGWIGNEQLFEDLTAAAAGSNSSSSNSNAGASPLLLLLVPNGSRAGAVSTQNSGQLIAGGVIAAAATSSSSSSERHGAGSNVVKISHRSSRDAELGSTRHQHHSSSNSSKRSSGSVLKEDNSSAAVENSESNSSRSSRRRRSKQREEPDSHQHRHDEKESRSKNSSSSSACSSCLDRSSEDSKKRHSGRMKNNTDYDTASDAGSNSSCRNHHSNSSKVRTEYADHVSQHHHSSGGTERGQRERDFNSSRNKIDATAAEKVSSNSSSSNSNSRSSNGSSRSRSSHHEDKQLNKTSSSSTESESDGRRKRREGAIDTSQNSDAQSRSQHSTALGRRRRGSSSSTIETRGEQHRDGMLMLPSDSNSEYIVEDVENTSAVSSEEAFNSSNSSERGVMQEQYLLINSNSSSRDLEREKLPNGEGRVAAAAAAKSPVQGASFREPHTGFSDLHTSVEASTRLTARVRALNNTDDVAASASPGIARRFPASSSSSNGVGSSSKNNKEATASASGASALHLTSSSSSSSSRSSSFSHPPQSSSSPPQSSSPSPPQSSSSSLPQSSSSHSSFPPVSHASSASPPALPRGRAAAAAVVSGLWIEEEWRWLWLILMSVSLVILAGIASGLTTGLMAFDELQLLVVQQTGAGPQKQQAEAVCDLMRRNRHQLLVTLLLCNALAMEALPLCLDRLLSPVLAVLLSVTAILFVGEILPQALCTGRYQLAIAANLAPFVRLLLILFWPAAYPISKLLDYWLAERSRPSLYARADLKALIGLHQRDRLQPLLLQQQIETQAATREHTRRGIPNKAARNAEHQEPSAAALSRDTRDRSRDQGRGTTTTHRVAAAAAGATAVGGAAAAVGRAAVGAGGGAAAVEGGAAVISSAPGGTAAGSDRVSDAARGWLSGDTGIQRGMEGCRERNIAAAGEGGEAAEAAVVERWEEAAGSGEPRFPEEAAAAAAKENNNIRPIGGDDSLRFEGGSEYLQDAVGLHRDEVLIMQGALDMACKSVCDLMVPLEDVFMLEASVRLTRAVLIDVLAKGHSRIPVFENRRENIRGVLLMKSLVLIDPGAGVRVADLMRGRTFRRLCIPLFVAPTINPYQLLNEFQEGRCHMAFVTRDVAAYQQSWEGNTTVPVGAELLGIVTLEDVIEELIQEEIMDEFDRRFRAETYSSSAAVLDQPSSSSSSTSRCLRAMRQSSSSSYESGRQAGGRTGEELQLLLRRQQQHHPVDIVAQHGDIIEGMSSEIDTAGGSDGTAAAALTRFASLLLTGSHELTALQGGDPRDDVVGNDERRSATSILASSQLGGRASLLFASAPDIECGRALDVVVWGDDTGDTRYHNSSFRVVNRIVGRRLQQQQGTQQQQQQPRNRRRRKTATYLPISKNTAATYRPATSHVRSFTAAPSVVTTESHISVPPHPADALLSPSPSSSAPSCLHCFQPTPFSSNTTPAAASRVDNTTSPGRYNATNVNRAQHSPLTELS